MNDGWRLIYDGYDPQNEGLREALCVLGNGYFASRGCAAESVADEVHYPGTYIAGVYNRLASEVQGRKVFNEDLVNVPNWLPLNFRFDNGAWFSPDSAHLIEYRQILMLRDSTLIRELRFDDGSGRVTRLRQTRLVSMDSPHQAGQKMELEAENWSGSIEVCSALDGRVKNTGVARYLGLSAQHLEPVSEGFPNDVTQVLQMRTCQSGIDIAVGAVTRVTVDDNPLTEQAENGSQAGYTRQTFKLELQQGQQLTVEKICSIHNSRDDAISACGEAVMEDLDAAPSFAEIYECHKLRWSQLWNRFGLEVEWSSPNGVERATMILRLHIFHLLQTVSPHTLYADAGVPARGLHGEAYRGHVFWDELFILPVFNLRMPELTRTLLMYRYNRLPAARSAARAEGFQGVMFPWQSGSSGAEQTQVLHLNPRSGKWIPDRSHLQRHVSLAIAYNVWKYHEASDDSEFLVNYGARLFLEIAAFWASMAEYDPEQDRYSIHEVMGPDEYHDGYPGREQGGLSNNTYTNVMVSWTLKKALELLVVLPRTRKSELCDSLRMEPDDLQRWEHISKKLKIEFHSDGIPSQFEGYEQLEEFDWQGYREKYGDIHRLDRILNAEGKDPNRYKISKQPDVLMLFFLLPVGDLQAVLARLGYSFEAETIDRTIDYYLQRTADGSTLSKVAHAHLLAQQQPQYSWNLFVEALRSDIDDVQRGTTREGIHLGAMAGTVDLMQSVFVGLDARVDALHLEPSLPEPLTRIELNITYRGHFLNLDIRRDRVMVSVDASELSPFQLVVFGDMQQMHAGEYREFGIS